MFSYSSCSKAGFQYLNCVSVGPFIVVFDSPAISCQDQSYLRWRPLAVAVLVAYVLLGPVWLAIGLCFANSKQLLGIDQTRFQLRYGALFTMYRQQTFWWESAALLRRTVMVGATVLFSSNAAAKGLCVTLVCFVALVAQLLAHPFRDKVDQHLESASLCILVFVSLSVASYSNEMLPFALHVLVVVFATSFASVIIVLIAFEFCYGEILKFKRKAAQELQFQPLHEPLLELK